MPLSAEDTAHLIRRTGFGVTPALFAELQGRSRSAAVQRVLDFSGAPSDQLAPVHADPFFANYNTMQLMRAWWLDRMITTPAPFQEKMTLFWHSHFVSAPDKVFDYNLLVRQNQLLRHQSLGSYRDLVQAISVDPAMLIYLDNYANVASSPQENFGRELLEVFTLGPSGRTEADVVGMTRAWTGHGLEDVGSAVFGAGSSYVFHPEDHDNGRKQIFDLAPRNWDGPRALDELLLRSRRDRVSQFVAAKLFSFLARPVGPDDPVVAPLAARFRESGLSIRALAEAILLSDEFWSASSRGQLVRSPAEWVVAALQATGLEAALLRPDLDMPMMGQQLFHPPSVAGWGQNGYWLATARTWGKAAFARRLSAHTYQLGLFSDTLGMSPADVATRGFEQFGILSPSAHTRGVVEAWVRRSREAGEGTLIPQNLVVLLLLSPDFQVS